MTIITSIDTPTEDVLPPDLVGFAPLLLHRQFGPDNAVPYPITDIALGRRTAEAWALEQLCPVDPDKLALLGTYPEPAGLLDLYDRLVAASHTPIAYMPGHGLIETADYTVDAFVAVGSKLHVLANSLGKDPGELIATFYDRIDIDHAGSLMGDFDQQGWEDAVLGVPLWFMADVTQTDKVMQSFDT